MLHASNLVLLLFDCLVLVTLLCTKYQMCDFAAVVLGRFSILFSNILDLVFRRLTASATQAYTTDDPVMSFHIVQNYSNKVSYELDTSSGSILNLYKLRGTHFLFVFGF